MTPSGFSKKVFSTERVKPYRFAIFNIIISHIFPENFIEIAQVVQNICRFSLSILTVFINFWVILIFPCYKENNDASTKQVMSALFYFQRTWNRFLAFVLIYIDIRIVHLGIWRGESDPARKILSSKSLILIGLIYLLGVLRNCQPTSGESRPTELQGYQTAVSQRTSCDFQAKSFKFTTLQVSICQPTSFQRVSQQSARLRSKSK